MHSDAMPDRRAAPVTLRSATPNDAGAIAAIYAPYVRDTSISFETVPPSANEMRARIEATLAGFPYLVAERGGAVIGYAYAGAFHRRAAYRTSAEVSAYVADAARGTGAGGALYTALLDELRVRGFHVAVAIITLPNEASVALHERFGFHHVGTLREIGAKFGAWRDVGWWQLRLSEANAPD